VTTPQSEEQIQSLFARADLCGAAALLKVVTGAESDEDCHRIHRVGSRLDKPYIGVCLGPAGQLSRVLNKRFTPVTHSLMATAAPGQLSVAQLMEQRVARSLLQPCEYSLFGTPIQHSLSPAMHNAAFAQLLLPHTHDAHSERVFGGASVTIPHKEAIIPFLHRVEFPADVIGAVNTVLVEREVATAGSGRTGTQSCGYC
jgi:pentafunctional AROM polypeptide